MAAQQIVLILAARDEMTPVVAGASGSLGKLRSAAGSASDGFTGASTAARDFAKRGLADLLRDVPIAGDALATMTRHLGGFSLVAGGVIVAGVGIIKMLTDMNTAATKELESITKLSESIGTDFRAAQLETAKITAEATNRRLEVIKLGYQQELAAADKAKQQTIATARAEFEAVNNSWFASLQERLNSIIKYQTAKKAAEEKGRDDAMVAQARENAGILALLNEQIAAVEAFEQQKRSARATAESGALTAEGRTTAALQVSINEQVALVRDGYAKQVDILRKLFGEDSESFNEQRIVAEQTMQDKLRDIFQKGADQRRAILEQSTADALAVFSKLGPQFDDIAQSLGLAKFLQDSERELLKLNTALDAGAITQEQYTRGTKALKDAMADAARNGAAPMAKTLNDVSAAANTSARAFDDMSREATALAGSLKADDTALAAAARSGGTFISTLTQIQQASFLARLKAGEFGDEYADKIKIATDLTSALVDRIDDIGSSLDRAADGFSGLTATATGSVPDTVQGTGPGGLVTIDDLFRSGFLKFSGGAGFAGLADGGMVSRPTLAMVGESQPEMVVGSPTSQGFAREFAVAIARELRQAPVSQSRSPQVIQLVVDRKVLAHAVVPTARKEAGRGTL